LKVLVIGATGFVGHGIARAFQRSGYEVYGLARSTDAGAWLTAHGVGRVDGNLDNVNALASRAGEFDVVIFAPMIPYESERATVTPLLDACERAGRTFIFTSGTGVLGSAALDGEWSQETYAEDSPFMPPPWLAMRVELEDYIRGRSAGGLRAMIVRPPLVWGHGGSKQVPAFFDSARATGQVCYVGKGLNLYSNVHVDDLSNAFVLAAEKGTPGAIYHAVGGEANFRQIAEAAAEVLKTTARSVTYEEACKVWDEVIVKFGLAVNSRSIARRTRTELGWVPEHVDLIADIRSGSYRQAYGV
jgi:nucleoside-diphosphate-sugar epimerase